MRSKSLLVGTAALATLFGLEAAQAQTPSSGEGTRLEEVIVTARRTEESLQSVPVTVSAFSTETIRERGIRSANDLMMVTPGIYTLGSGSPNNTLYSIRGQSKPISGLSPAGVVSYFAEVPLPTQSSAPPQYDLASIQVLKGPQGTLFGRNTLGGAILVYPNNATYDFNGYTQATFGNYDWFELEGAVNLPIVTDKVALRVAGRYGTRDGYQKNLGGDREPAGNMNSKSIRGTLLVEPTDWLSNTLIADYNHETNDGAPTVLLGLNPASAAFAPFSQFLINQYNLRVQRGPRVADSGALVTGEQLERWGFTNRTEIQLGEKVRLVNLASYRRIFYGTQSNIDALPTFRNFPFPGNNFEFLSGSRQFQLTQKTEELQFRGTLLDDKFSWLLGAFYLQEQPHDANFDSLVILGSQTNNYSFLRTKSKALFGNFSYDLSDVLKGLKANIGYRYTWDSVNLCSAAAAVVPPNHTITRSDCAAPGNPSLTNQSIASTKTEAPTWSIGLDWQVNDDVFLYVTSRRGYRAGGLNSPHLGPNFAGFQGFAPETVTDFETGFRSDWRLAGMTGRLNVSAFTQKNTDVQVPIPGLTTTQVPGFCLGNPPAPVWLDGDCNRANDPSSGTLIFNTGKTRVRGIEIDAAVRPVRDLTISFTGSFMQQKILESGVPPVGAAVANPSQVFFQQAPEKGYTLGLEYRLPFVPEDMGEVKFNAFYSRMGKVNAQAYVIPAHEVTNVRLDWSNINGMPVDAALFVRNLNGNADPIGSAINVVALPWFSAIFSEPRFYGVELRYRFGSQ
jgi:iron complex outermembrane receptor protein